MKRYGMVIGLRPEQVDEYKKLHAAVWPDVLKMIRQCHIQNYSIYLRQLDDGRHYLFSYFEYTGARFRRRHGEDGRRSNDSEMVGRLQTVPATADRDWPRRVVGRHGRSVPSGLTAQIDLNGISPNMRRVLSQLGCAVALLCQTVRSERRFRSTNEP